MTLSELKEKLSHCPRCGRHCPIDAVSCPRGEELVQKLLNGEMDVEDAVRQTGDHAHGEHHRGERSQGGHPRGEHDHRAGRPPEMDFGGPEGPGREGFDGPPPRRGPHGDFHHDRRRGHCPPPPEDDSLESLLHRCMHALRHGGHAGAQRKVLELLNEKGPLAQRDVQAAFGVQPGSLSELIGKLEGKGWIEQERDEQDRRRAMLHLTDAGKETLRSAAPRMDFFAALSQEEKEQLRSLLKKALDANKPGRE